jgi:hypothetical protein
MNLNVNRLLLGTTLGAAVAVGLPLVTPAHALTIVPTFDSTITSDPNAAAIEGVINQAITTYDTTFADPITVPLNFAEMTTGLGQSNFSVFAVPYATFSAALAADAKSSNDAAAVAKNPIAVLNPVTGTDFILAKPANMDALGLTHSAVPNDGVISLNTHLTDIGSPGTTGQYSLLAVAEHEMDEMLGLGSTLGLGLGSPFNNDPSTEDLFRYDSSGNRSFNLSGAVQSFFSINGTVDLGQFDNQADGGDYGDWQSNPLPGGVLPKVQDAFATPGSHPTLGIELTALDVIGYDLISVPEPASMAVLIPALAGLRWVRRRRRS